MSHLSILIIDNNRSRNQSLKMLLEFMDFKTNLISSLSDYESLDKKYHIVIYGDKSVNDILSALRDLSSTIVKIPFILLENDPPLPMELIQQQFPFCLGIFNEPFKQDSFLSLIADLTPKPLQSKVVQFTKETASSLKQNTEIKSGKHAEQPYLEANLIGQSEGIKKVKKLILQVAKSNANVLILGESGTGKEVVAHCVHQLSKRQNQAYVPVNCGAIPADLLESELFGHEKGAFTGAINARQGRFELAQSGTLFLDEIGDMPLAMQVKILRVLQEKMFERVGGNKSIRADVRILAATHRNLEERVNDGSFREDLFYRLNVFPIEIPPLRERVSDIPLLVQFLNQSIEQERDESVIFSESAMASIFLHSWPGNIRELANLVERLAIIFGSERIEYDDLPEKYQNDISDFDFSRLQNNTIPHSKTTFVVESETKIETKKPLSTSATMSTIKITDNLVEKTELSESFAKHQIHDLTDNGSFDLKLHLGNLEQTLIEDALSKSNYVVAHAAKRLNIRRTTLVEKMRKYAISVK